MIFPFYAVYVLKDIENDSGYLEFELNQKDSYGNGRTQIEKQLIERNGGSTKLSAGRPKMFYTEFSNNLVPRISLTCFLGTVEMYTQGIVNVCDVDIVMEIQIDSMFEERVVAFVDYLSRILNLTNDEMHLFRQEMLAKANETSSND